jgi:hypothetical protein
MSESNGKSWTEHFRIITPFLLLIITGFATVINSKLNDIDSKLFHHLTNDEMHCPRSVMVTKAEYDACQRMIESDIKEIKEMLRRATYGRIDTR